MKSNYLNLLKIVLTNSFNIGGHELFGLKDVRPNWKTRFLYPINKILHRRNFTIAKIRPVTYLERINGYDWPANALIMVGVNRLTHLENCFKTVIEDSIKGDLVETGVWRGGVGIFMTALIKENNCQDRKVWLADSFEGMPKPDTNKFPEDKLATLFKEPILSVSLDEVQRNFENFEMLSDQVIFVKGWFKDTLPDCQVKQISILRLDGDLYESTIIALNSLYTKVSLGGFVIIDDYNAFPYCKKAVDDFRDKYNIISPLIEVDQECVYWKKTT